MHYLNFPESLASFFESSIFAIPSEMYPSDAAWVFDAFATYDDFNYEEI